MLLQDKLDALKAECLAKTPPKVTLVRQRAVEGLAASGLAERAMHAGEQAPAFQLRDGYGGAFSSREALRRGPIGQSGKPFHRLLSNQRHFRRGLGETVGFQGVQFVLE